MHRFVVSRPDGFNRQQVLARLSALASATVAAVAIADRARAARRWCVADPVVSIDGQIADLYMMSDIALHNVASGPAIIRVSLPEGSRGTAILSDLGFGLHGYDIKFQTDRALAKTSGRTQVQVSVYVGSEQAALPLKITLAPRTGDAAIQEVLLGNTAEGRVDEWITLRA